MQWNVDINNSSGKRMVEACGGDMYRAPKKGFG
jgi:hypothetical protein